MDTTPTLTREPARPSRRLTTVLGFGLAAVLATTAIVTSAAGTPAVTPPQAPDGHPRVMRFHVTFSPFNVVDVPPTATSQGDYRPGDYVTFSDVLARAGKRVGVEAGTGTITKVSSTGLQVYFSMAIRLPGGQITAQGLSSNAPTKRLALTGGTGRFVGAAGHLDLLEHRHGTGSLVVTVHAPSS